MNEPPKWTMTRPATLHPLSWSLLDESDIDNNSQLCGFVLAHIESPYAHNTICKFHMHTYIFFIQKLSLSLLTKWNQVNVRSTDVLSVSCQPTLHRVIIGITGTAALSWPAVCKSLGLCPVGSFSGMGCRNSNQPSCDNNEWLWVA